MQEFKLITKIDNDKILCDILGNEEEVEYAYYLKRNGVRIQAIWYSKKSDNFFEVSYKGVYQVVGFVRTNTKEVVILESELMLIEGEEHINEAYDLSNYSVSIFGCCISRDLLEFNIENNFSLVKYFARCSIVSAVSEPIFIKEDDIPLSSAFQRRQIAADLDKRIWKELRENYSDYLLIDFVDERFPLGKYQNSYFTFSNDIHHQLFQDNCLILNKEKADDDIYVENRSLKEHLDEFWDRVLEIYTPERIILHRAKLSDYYLDEEGKINEFPSYQIEKNNKINTILEYMYTYTEKKLQNCIVACVKQDFYAAQNHKWGLAPMHYSEDYYIAILNDIYEKIAK